MKRLVLDGNDWEVTGLWRNQTEFVRAYSDRIIDTGLPAVLPIKAEVPGNINKDLMKAGIVPDYNIDLNSIYGEWVEHREWVYRKCFSVPENLKGYSNILCFEGLDYEGEIILNDKVLYCFKGMFKPVEIDVTNFLRYGGINTLEVLFYPAPEIDGMYGYSSRLTHLKSRFNYLWDWCVRIVPVGIWDHVYIKSFKKVCFSDIYTRTALDERNGILELFLDMICNTEGEFEISIKLFYESGNNIVLEKHQVVDFHKGINNFKRIFNISGVKPWWPNGYGEQHLYTLKISIIYRDDG